MPSRKLLTGLFTAVLFSAMPLLAQEPPKDQPQDSSSKPTFEKPGMAAPEEAKPVEKKAPPAKKPAASTGEGAVVEEIIARVNNEIITKSEFDKAKATAVEEAQQDCQNRCTPEQLQTSVDERQKTALRDLIDQSLLVQRGKDMGTSVETDVIKRLDQIRTENKLDSMEDLEKAVTSQGLNWEDFKNNIRNTILTQKVIGSEVGSHINISKEEVQKYYDDHKAEFVRPEQVALSEIEVKTEGKPADQIPELKKKAETALKRVQDGESFAEIAKRLSDGSTAKQGGYLGIYKKGELSKQLEDAVFTMKKNQLTDVMETKQGFLILEVMEHYDEGQQALAKVENEIMNKLYDQRMQPALREYLKTLREQSYVIIKPGFQDAAGGSGSEIQEVSATPEAAAKAKKGHKKYLLFGKKDS